MGRAVISVHVALLYYFRELITSTGPTLNITVRLAVGRAVSHFRAGRSTVLLSRVNY